MIDRVTTARGGIYGSLATEGLSLARALTRRVWIPALSCNAEGVTNWNSSSDDVQEGIETICIDSPTETFMIGEEAKASNGALVRNLKAKACIQKSTLQSFKTTASLYGPNEGSAADETLEAVCNGIVSLSPSNAAETTIKFFREMWTKFT